MSPNRNHQSSTQTHIAALPLNITARWQYRRLGEMFLEPVWILIESDNTFCGSRVCTCMRLRVCVCMQDLKYVCDTSSAHVPSQTRTKAFMKKKQITHISLLVNSTAPNHCKSASPPYRCPKPPSTISQISALQSVSL